MAAKKQSRAMTIAKKAGKVAATVGGALGGAALVVKGMNDAYPVGSRGYRDRITGKQLLSPAGLAEEVAGRAAQAVERKRFMKEAGEQGKPSKKSGMRKPYTKA